MEPSKLCPEYKEWMEGLEADARLAKLAARVASLNRESRRLAYSLFPPEARAAARERLMFARSTTNLSYSLASTCDRARVIRSLAPGEPAPPREDWVTVLTADHLRDLEVGLREFEDREAPQP